MFSSSLLDHTMIVDPGSREAGGRQAGQQAVTLQPGVVEGIRVERE